MSIFKKLIAESEAKFMANVSDAVKERRKSGRPLDVEEFEMMLLNSYERHHLVPIFTDQLLLKTIGHYLEHCDVDGPREYHEHWMNTPVYDQQLLGCYVPVLLERLKAAEMSQIKPG